MLGEKVIVFAVLWRIVPFVGVVGGSLMTSSSSLELSSSLFFLFPFPGVVISTILLTSLVATGVI